ncbi:MAG: ABC transporter substrate-binding protein [Thermodesulfobacteriota bacterium]
MGNGVFSLVVAAVAGVLAVAGCEHRPAVKPKKVGIVNPSAGLEQVVAGFKAGLAERGHQEGETIVFRYDGPLQGSGEVDSRIAALIAEDVDLILGLTTPVARRLKEALTGTAIPGLFAPVFAPAEAGLVESLARPGGPVTGIRIRGSTAKALEYLLAVVPGVRRVYVPCHAGDMASCLTRDDLEAGAVKLGVELVSTEVDGLPALQAALAAIPPDVQAVWLTCSHLLTSQVREYVVAATARGIPVASCAHLFSGSGVMISYGENDFRMGEQAGRMADRLLNGASPQTMPVETASFYLRINRGKARELGIEVPERLLQQATFIED